MTDRIVRTTEVAAPIERVWRALTNHEEFGEWFRVKLDGPFVLGGSNGGHITYEGYEHLPWQATLTAMDAPRLFAFTWPHVKGEGEDLDAAPRTLVEFRLEPMAGGTRVTVTESGFDALPEHQRSEAIRENSGGWTIQMENIKAHVER